MITKQRTRLPASSRSVRATSAYAGGGERSRAASCRHAGTRPLASRVSVLALAIAMSIGPVSAQQIMAIGDVNPQPASGTTDWELWEQSLYVGNGGVGYLGISGGATVRSSFTDVFGSSAGDGFIGFSTGDKGTVEVFGAGSTWQLNGGSLYVGHNGEGTLLVNREGTVIADAMYIASGGEIDDGFEPGTGSGTVIVSGVGSALKIHPAAMQHSHLRVGYFGEGELIVEKGGTVSHLPFAEGVIDIGSWPGGDGKITVTDAGSTMTTIGTLIVGNYGPGELTVTNGGAVSNNQGVVGNGPGFEYEGQSFSGGVGTVAVSGEGSRWTSLGSLTVGNGNKGTLVITDGGVVSSNEGNPDKTSYIGAVASENGDYDPGHGLVTVSGSGSRWIAHGGLVVGGYGIGVLAIENEGVVSSKASYIGRYGVSDGEATVSGVDSAWVIDGNLHVGGEGNGVLTIKDGGKVSQAGGKVTLAVQSGSAGTLNIGAGAGEAAAVAGTLEANAIAFGAGNGTLVFNHRGGADGSELIFASSLSGAGSIVHEHGTTTLSGDGSGFAGTTTVEGGTFQIGNGGTSGSLAGDIAVASTGTLVFNRSDDLTYADKVSGAGALTKRGAGTLTLTGNNDYYATYADGGTLTVDDGGTVDNTLSLIGRNGGNAIIVVTGGGSHWTSGTLAVGYTGTGAFLVEDGGTVTSENVIVGGESGSAGTLTLASGGTVSDDSGVILAQTGTSGTLNIGAAAGDAAAAAGVLDTPTLAFGAGTGTLVFNHTGSVGFTPVLQGTGTITHQAGNTRLTADSSGFSGATTVQGGELKIVQALGGDAVIQDSGLLTVGGRLIGSATARGGGELTGGGVIGGDAAIEAGGVLSNESWRTLNIKGDLTLSGDAQVNVALDAPGNTDALFAIGGDLTLDGTVNVSDAGDFGPGTYLLMGYGGTLTDNGLEIGTTPTGYDSDGFQVQVDTAGKRVNLLAPLAAGYGFWDGVGPVDNGQVNGGTGTWTADGSDTSWTSADGSVNGAYENPTFAIFQGEAGTVTIDNAAGQVSADGLQFAVDGYTLDGDALALTGVGTLRVGDGTDAGAAMTATIAADLTATGAVRKTDLGTLVLTGDNTWGSADIATGTVQLAEGGTATTGAVTVGFNPGEAGTLDIGADSTWTASDRVQAGLGGTGTVRLHDGGTLTATGLQLAGFDVGTGTLVIGAAAGEAASAAGTLDAASLSFGPGTGTVVFNHTDQAYTFGADLVGVGGAGALQHEAGTTSLTGDSSGFTGLTTVNGGTLVVANTLGGDATANGGELQVDGTFTGDVLAGGGGTISGGGTIDGNVGMGPSGILKGVQGQTLTITGALALNDSSLVDVSLGTAGNTDALFAIGGDLTLDGTVNITDAGDFGAGIYRLMDYAGTLTDGGLEVGATPADFLGELAVQTSVAGEVNLAVEASDAVLQFWDGSAAGNADNGAIDGGAGTWTADGTTWTDVDGGANGAMNPSPGFAIFQGEAGTVTLDASAGDLQATGLQFASDGYGLEGDRLTLTEGVSTLRVGDGTDAGAAMTATIAADLTATGAVRKTDLGTLVLTGDNTWGSADIATGTVQLAEGGTATTGAVTVGFNPGEAGTLDIGADSSWTSNDEVQAGFGGTGTVRLHDGGTLTATGLQLAGFDVGTGTLVIGAAAGEAASAAGTLDAPRLTFGPGAGTLVFNHTDEAYDFGAALVSNEAGNGTLQHLAGMTTLSGDSSGFSGTTQVAGGTLWVNGVLGGTLSVAAGGTLGGTGTVGTVDNAGTVAPGSSIGTLTIDGDYVHRAGATLLAEIEPGGTSDLLDIAGSATLEGGEVYVLKAPGQYQGQTRYTLLEAAGGVSGTFATLAQNSPFLDLALAYDAQHVFLDVTRNSTDFGIVCAGGTFNQCQVGTTLDVIGEGEQPPTLELQQALAEASTLSLEQAQAAFDRLSGEAHASLSGLVLEGHALHGQSVTRRLVDRREAEGMTALQGGSWARGYGQRSDLAGDGNAHGADLRVHGLAVGVDAWASESWLVGASLNAMQLEADLRPGDRGRADSKNVSLYTSVQGERAYLDGVVSYAWWDNEVERAVQLGAIGSRAKADYDGHRFATYLEAGYRFDLGGGQQLQPLLSVQYDKVDQAGFREEGAGDLDLVGRSHDVDRLTVAAGLRWQGRLDRGQWTLQPSAQARWLHGAGDAHAEFDVALAGAPQAHFRVRGVELPRNRAVLGVGLTADKGDQLQLFVNYDYQHGDRDYRAHQLGAGLRWRW